jgi:hypothetical protein
VRSSFIYNRRILRYAQILSTNRVHYWQRIMTMHKMYRKEKKKVKHACFCYILYKRVVIIVLLLQKYKMTSFETPLQLGPLRLKNRVIMASLTRDRNLIPGPLQVEYYIQRAGAGLILTEGTLIEPLGSEWTEAR